jgi:hypothetical protein
MKETFKVRKNFFFKGVFLIKSLSFKDKRGEFIEKYNEIFFKKLVKKIKFVEDDLSFSKNNVFRGIHADNKAWKLFSCIYGTITFFFLDLRIQEKTFFNIKRHFSCFFGFRFRIILFFLLLNISNFDVNVNVSNTSDNEIKKSMQLNNSFL